MNQPGFKKVNQQTSRREQVNMERALPKLPSQQALKASPKLYRAKGMKSPVKF